MSTDRNPSLERRNAFVDGQLDREDLERMLARMAEDPRLREEIAELRTLKDLVRHAYPAPAEGRSVGARGGRISRWGWAAAAGIAMLTAGWFGHAWWTDRQTGSLASVPSTIAGRPVPAGQQLVVHFGSRDQASAVRALDEIEDLLRGARSAGRTVRVEIVANGTGLDLLRTDASVLAARLTALRAEFPALGLIACGQTLQRLESGGLHVTLLPGTEVAPSALDQVVKRLQEAWVYVRV